MMKDDRKLTLKKKANDIFEKVIHSDIIDKISNYKY